MSITTFETVGGVSITATTSDLDVDSDLERLIDRLDSQRGLLLSSSYEYPGRYTRWDMGFVQPPLVLTAVGHQLNVEALNSRGEVLLPAISQHLANTAGIVDVATEQSQLSFSVEGTSGQFDEAERSRQPSSFSAVRAIVELFATDQPHLGLYGAFGYDLAFQFEPIDLTLPRGAAQRDLVLYLPDELFIVDHDQGIAEHIHYEFEVDGVSTVGLGRDGVSAPYKPDLDMVPYRDHEPGGYAQGVERAREYFARGDLFEVVTSQTFIERCPEPPSELFRRLKEQNPSPYGFLINLGQDEWLVGASPEMYVRVEGDRVETCPISGTIARGRDPIDDASQILALLNSEKDESELTMCTDVDRNDKSRVCIPGSVNVIGRRQIEMYSRLIHTVDHVEGRLRPEFDALDAFLTHTWAVTVTGAPKTKAMVFLERNERSARAWYGGAVGKVGFDGSLNTGLTLRTIRVLEGHAEFRVGATLLWDSDPAIEEAETELKASAFLDAIRQPRRVPTENTIRPTCDGVRVLLVDHLDSFVHTLANYLRQIGAQVTTRRAGFSLDEISPESYDLVVLSPGPGRPTDFAVAATVGAAVDAGIPVFGVCLGLQGIVEYLGGTLDQLDTPMHGKPSLVNVVGGRLLHNLGGRFRVGRYHSLYASRSSLPAELIVSAETDDGIIMAIEHQSLPIAAVQFHPESIMSMDEDVGIRMIEQVVSRLVATTGDGTVRAQS